ncbi:MAG TPA: VPDSG-CTERM sorting domain-containing protein [Lacunisphaera sp.]
MKSIQSVIRISVCAFFCVGAVQLMQGTPTLFKYGSFSVEYSQTTSGTTTVQNHNSSLGVVGSEVGDFDLSIRFPSSVTYSGSPLFPGNQLELVIPYDSSVSTVSGANYSGGAMANSSGVLPNSGGLGMFWSGASVWSPNSGDVQSLTATLNGGILDGDQTTMEFDPNLLPHFVPLLTNQSLNALANVTKDQATALSFIQPLSPAVFAFFSIHTIDNQNSYHFVSDGELDLVQNPSGLTLPPGTFLEGNNYLLSFWDFWNVPDPNGHLDSYSYGTSNQIRFTVKSSRVPDTGSTIAMLGSALLGLATLRRKSATHSDRVRF